MSVQATTAVWTQSLSTGNARLVLLALADSANKQTGETWLDPKGIAEMTRISLRDVRRQLKVLEESGELIVVEPGGGRGRVRRWRINLGAWYEETVTGRHPLEDEKQWQGVTVSQGLNSDRNSDKRVTGSALNSDKRVTDPTSTLYDQQPRTVIREPSPASPAPRPRDPYVDAAADAFGIEPTGHAGRLFGMIAAKARGQGHDPDEIPRRVALHLAVFSFACTPASVHKRWEELGSRVVTATAADRKRAQQELERMRRNERIREAMA